VQQETNNNYIIRNFSYIKENHNHFIEYANLAHQRFNFAYGNKTSFNQNSSTWFYRYYNITCLTFGSSLYYKLFSDLQSLIKEIAKNKKPLWYQSWLNFHKPNEVLDWHNHYECLLHGYISIDPKESETEFEDYKIKNEIGNIYIGKPEKKHKVNVLKPFDGHRITIAFDVVDENCINDIYKKYGNIDVNTGFIPII
jgi:hypothetical protein